MLSEIPCERSPRNGNVHITIRDSVNDSRRRIALAVIAVQREADDVIYDSARCQCVRRWSVDAVVANELHADFEISQLRIVE